MPAADSHDRSWSLPALAVRRPVTVAMCSLAVLLLGTVSLGELPVDLLPDIGTPRMTLLTRAEGQGLAPAEVERLVTMPLEDAVATVPGVRRVSSVSREGLSVITVELPWDTDLDLASLRVREAVDAVRQALPEGVDRPAVLRWDPGSEPIMGIAVAGGDSLAALRELAERVVVPRLEQVDGVAGARVTGGARREVHVTLDADRMTLFGVTSADVERALQAANAGLQSGNVLQGALRYQVRAMGEFRDLQEIADVVVGGDAGVAGRIRLRDIGSVTSGARPRLSGTLLDDREAVGLLVHKESGANTVQAVAATRGALEELRLQYPELTIRVAFENASFIEEAIASVIQNIGLGGVLAFLVLFLFLRDPRNPLLIGIAIPVSIVATFVLCYFAGITLNIMTLGGLALGVGLLVDNSIVVLENIFRIRQEGAEPVAAARRGADQVGMAVAAATFTTIAVFLPIAYVHGVAGRLFAAQAWTVTFALLASLLVSLTVLPMLASRFLRLGDAPPPGTPGEPAREGETGAAPRPGGDSDTSSHERRRRSDGGRAVSEAGETTSTGADGLLARLRRLPGHLLETLLLAPLLLVKLLVGGLRRLLAPVLELFALGLAAVGRAYHATLEVCLRQRLLTILGALALIALGVGVGRSLPWELMPAVNTGRFDVLLDAPPGTPYERLQSITRDLADAARDTGHVEATFATIGAEPGALATTGSLDLSPTRARLTVVLAGDPAGRRAAARDATAAVRAAARRAGDVRVVVDPQTSPLQRLLGLEDTGFRILLRGDDLDLLEDLATRTAERLGALPGFADVQPGGGRGNPEIRIRVRRDAAARHGVSVQEITRALQGALQGTIPTQFVEFDRRIDIRVLTPTDRAGIEALMNRLYRTPGGRVPFRELVDAETSVGPREILRRDGRRELPVTAVLDGIPLSEAVERAERALAEESWPADTSWRVGGEREEVDASFRSLAWALALAAALVYMVMAAQFESLRHPLVILLSLPLGWVGVVLALGVAGLTVNVVALIGAVVLTGIVVNDGIVKIDTINRLRRDGMPLRAAVLRGSGLRLRPILMTSVTTVSALIPLAMGLGAGAELQRPLAIAVIGGEFTGTLLTLLVLPVLYELIEDHFQ